MTEITSETDGNSYWSSTSATGRTDSSSSDPTSIAVGDEDSWFTDYNTRIIWWHNTGEHVQLFVAGDADVGTYDPEWGFLADDEDPDRPVVYEVSPDWSIFEDYQNLASIDFSPVENEVEDQLLQSDDWWEEQDESTMNGGGSNTSNSS